MVQKPLNKKGNKAPPKPKAANRHGKLVKVKKGGLSRPPKKDAAKQQLLEGKELTSAINARNEAKAAGLAAQHGGRLLVVSPPADHSSKGQKETGKRTPAG